MRPLDRVGCYVPGGRYPLPSSLLMTAIPARVAGVAEIRRILDDPQASPNDRFVALMDRFMRTATAPTLMVWQRKRNV